MSQAGTVACREKADSRTFLSSTAPGGSGGSSHLSCSREFSGGVCLTSSPPLPGQRPSAGGGGGHRRFSESPAETRLGPGRMASSGSPLAVLGLLGENRTPSGSATTTSHRQWRKRERKPVCSQGGEDRGGESGGSGGWGWEVAWPSSVQMEHSVTREPRVCLR